MNFLKQRNSSTSANQANKSAKPSKKKRYNILISDNDKEPDNNNTDQDGNGSDNAIIDTTEVEEEVIKKIRKDLTKQKAPIYTFFEANPEIEFANNGTAEYISIYPDL
ncbi:hypothetical protein BT96DRAFT_1006989 [Gymnopus androsaceus JB14]|uniref:Uncharacterized protein n=1 Tax=Gymnopus androsaceus JB14 TaxID=1447944 RepID=A0A6A4GIS3_9AGAR|nr:hypothetical protein BT96DRAFT_1006989 [Gymnopus androsaceus JB14]